MWHISLGYFHCTVSMYSQLLARDISGVYVEFSLSKGLPTLQELLLGTSYLWVQKSYLARIKLACWTVSYIFIFLYFLSNSEKKKCACITEASSVCFTVLGWHRELWEMWLLSTCLSGHKMGFIVVLDWLYKMHAN